MVGTALVVVGIALVVVGTALVVVGTALVVVGTSLVVVGTALDDVVEVLTVHWQVAEQPDSGAQKAPPTDPGGSHCSPSSMMLFPHIAVVGVVLVVVELDVVEVLSAGVLVEVEVVPSIVLVEVVLGMVDELVVDVTVQ